MIDDVFAQRVFDKFDKIDERLDETCGSIADIKTDMAVLKTKFGGHIEEKEEEKQDKKDKKAWYFGIVSFVFFAYIAIKEFM